MEKTRKNYDENLKWNVKDLYKSEDEYKKDYDGVNSNLKVYDDFKGHILDNAESLLKLLKFDVEVGIKVERIYIYSHIQNDEDTTNTKNQELYNKAVKLYEAYSEATSFIVPELLKSDYRVIEKFLEENDELKEYERMLKNIFRMKEHVLSDEEEKLLSSLSCTFRTSEDVYSYLTDADLKFGTIKNEFGEDEELSEKTYHKLIRSSKRNVRKSAFEGLLNVYGNFKNAYASLLASEVTSNNKMASIRRYDSALEASLFGNEIPLKIYSNLIEQVRKNISPLSKFWKLKKEVLGLDELHIYDTYAPLVEEFDKTYTYDEARDIILNSLEVLGSNYVEDLKHAFSDKWIDSCSNDGKRNGAYCTACYGVHPYVLLSYDGSLNSVSTLAHELGHAMHYYYAMKNQNYQDYNYSIFVAEVASQVNQILLSKYLIEQTDYKKEKAYLIDDLIGDFKSTIIRQTMFAEFELKIHELEAKGQALTHEALCNIYYDLNKDYYGKNIVVDDIIKYEWERIPHFYMDFYVYQYATAYAASIILAKNILEGAPGAVESYIKFLGLGCTKSPVESLKIAGVDMESETVLKGAFDYFENLIKELEENLK